MDKTKLENEITQFRDGLKEYQKILREIWSEGRGYSNNEKIKELTGKKENPLREKLVENFGKIEKYFKKIGVGMNAVKFGRVFPIFDTALDSDISGTIKGETLEMSIQMATKAIGIVKSLDDKEYKKIDKKTPTVFISFNFDEKNKNITKKFKDFISKFDVEILEGSEVNTISISEKVKTKINDADIIVAIMTKDEQDNKGVSFPSKWVIEELAYALANKNKEIIRLLEKGCDTNGRIFGDREYIIFDKEDPSEALIKLAGLLNKIIS